MSANPRSTITAQELADGFSGFENLITDTQARQIVNDRPRNEIAAFAIETFELLGYRLQPLFLAALQTPSNRPSVASDATVEP